MGVRKSYEHLTRDEQTRFVQALHRLKQAGVVDDFARVHRTYTDAGIHGTSHFLPWHREFLRRFETKLQEHDPRVSLPYWNSVAHQSSSDPLWRNDFMGQFDDAWRLGRQLGGVVLPNRRQLEDNQRRGRYAEFWPELEVVMHNSPHLWVGGAMATSSSPLDPVFFLHHAWIDRLWALWQRDHPGVPFEASRAGYGLTDPMKGFSDRTPAHVLNHHALGYTYDTDATVTAVKTRSEEGSVTLFVPGPEGKVWSNFWPAPNRPGQWSDWFPIGDKTFPKGATVTAVKTRSQEGSVTLFVPGPEGKVWSNFWPAPNRPGQWNGWFPIGDNTFAKEATVTAVKTRSEEGSVTLFVPGPEGKVWSNFWPAPNRPGQWNGWFPIGGKTFADNAPVTAIRTRSQEGSVTLFVPGPEGKIWSAFWPAPDRPGQWSDWFPIGDKTFPKGATVTAVKTRSEEGSVTLFVPGPEGKIWSAFWPAPDRPGQWSDWFPIGDNTFPKGATVTAVKTRSEEGSVTLFVSGEDGKVWSNFWPAPNRPGQWNGWFLIGDKTFADSAPVTAIRTRSQEGSVTLLLPGPEGPDGKVWSNFWPAPDRPGQWNGWFALGIKTFPVFI